MIALAVILAIIALIIFLPFGIEAAYVGAEFTLAARIGFLRLRLIPRKKPKKPQDPAKAEKKAAKKAEKKAKKEQKKAEKPPRPKPTREDIFAYARIGLDALGRLRRKLVVNRLMLHIVIAGRNAYDTAVTYGYASMALSMSMPLLESALNIKERDVWAAPSFEMTQPYIEAELAATLNLAKLIAVGAAAGLGFLKYRREKRREAKAAAIAASTERTDDNARDAA